MVERRDDIEKTLGLGRHRRRVPAWVRLLAGLAVLGLGGWLMFLRPEAGSDVVFQTEAAGRRDLSVTVSATGTVEPTNLVEISSELSGTLASVEVDYNDTVEVGQVLARLDTAKLRAQLAVQEAALVAAEAQVEQAQTNLREALDNLERAEELARRGVTTQEALAARKASYERAQAALQVADADRALADASVEVLRTDLDKAVLVAPIKGVILQRNADPGQIVASALSAPVLFTIAEDLASMELQVDIDEADIGAVAVGNRATFTVDAYDDETFPAEISEIRFAPETIEGVVSYKAILAIDNSDLRLRPGMTATAEIVVAELFDMMTVPNAALRYEPPQVIDAAGGESGSGLLGLIFPSPPPVEIRSYEGPERSVWVLRDGVPEEVPVLVGRTDGRHTAILEGDLAVGEQVITDQTGG